MQNADARGKVKSKKRSKAAKTRLVEGFFFSFFLGPRKKDSGEKNESNRGARDKGEDENEGENEMEITQKDGFAYQIIIYAYIMNFKTRQSLTFKLQTTSLTKPRGKKPFKSSQSSNPHPPPPTNTYKKVKRKCDTPARKELQFKRRNQNRSKSSQVQTKT